MSPPQKVNTGISKVEILGRTDQGILVRHTQKEDDEIVAFYDNMQQHWRKKIPVHEKNAIITHITTFDDSVIFFYTIAAKGVTELKAAKTSSRIESQARLVICESLSRNAFSQAPSPRSLTSQWRLIMRQDGGAATSGPRPATRTVTTTCSMMSSCPSRTRSAMKSLAVPMRCVLR